MGWLSLLAKIATAFTAVQNIGHRQAAARTMDEDVLTPEQTTGAVIQDFANRGIMIDPSSPAVQEALRRRSLAKRMEKAQLTLSGSDPFATLFGVISQS